MIKKKSKLAKIYNEELEKLDWIYTQNVTANEKHSLQSYVTHLDEKINRNKLIDLLKANGVQSQIGTYASHCQPVYAQFKPSVCINSKYLLNKALALPIYVEMKEEDCIKVIETLKKII